MTQAIRLPPLNDEGHTPACGPANKAVATSGRGLRCGFVPDVAGGTAKPLSTEQVDARAPSRALRRPLRLDIPAYAVTAASVAAILAILVVNAALRGP